jgi:hypothetical protein
MRRPVLPPKSNRSLIIASEGWSSRLWSGYTLQGSVTLARACGRCRWTMGTAWAGSGCTEIWKDLWPCSQKAWCWRAAGENSFLFMESAMGLEYASDTLGQDPFQAVVNDAVLSCIQMRTTLPTLDELQGLNDTTPLNVHERLLQATQD